MIFNGWLTKKQNFWFHLLYPITHYQLPIGQRRIFMCSAIAFIGCKLIGI
ncbi:MAG: hypothetical protein KME01_14850 [Chroococcus sp. CMT-3BRIN-NPC107]|nr:hypothetical protein [Chroococcus sp. CMT-3BRIN-NPC107]